LPRSERTQREPAAALGERHRPEYRNARGEKAGRTLKRGAAAPRDVLPIVSRLSADN